MPPRYPISFTTAFQIAQDTLRLRPRHFGADARALVRGLRPPIEILGERNIPARGPCLLTVNHYSRPGFRAWWLALAVSAAVPAEIHWIVTSAWTYPDPLRLHLVTPASRWLFRRVARVYAFTSMPPMPPHPSEVAGRARAVRQVLAYAHAAQRPLIGLAPEGMDTPGGALTLPPSGVGRLALQLAKLGLEIVPAGFYETEERACLQFGPAYRLCLPTGLSSGERDHLARQQLMRHIAALLPPRLRGEFA